jgi:hypothetical protein
MNQNVLKLIHKNELTSIRDPKIISSLYYKTNLNIMQKICHHNMEIESISEKPFYEEGSHKIFNTLPDLSIGEPALRIKEPKTRILSDYQMTNKLLPVRDNHRDGERKKSVDNRVLKTSNELTEPLLEKSPSSTTSPSSDAKCFCNCCVFI